MDRKITVVGLGYVGLPLAAELAAYFPVTGFDISEKRVSELRSGKDITCEVSPVKFSKISFTTDPKALRNVNFIIVAVPTPTTKAKQPDLSMVEGASKIVGENLSKGAVVVYESTVYPGVTEDICVPILEKSSGMRCGVDFKVGYSPERINPGDKEHTIDKVIKIVSGCDEDALNEVASVYSKICKAGVHKASSIKTAEAAKLIENIQRDLNIALVNELSLIFDKLGLNTDEVLEAAGTKWNFHKYSPGLVGGHCIPVVPYYLTYKAEELGFHSHVILAGRETNDTMYLHVAKLILKGLSAANKVASGSTVLILGLTFKENVPDYRNSKVNDVIDELKTYGVNVIGCEPLLSPEVVKVNFGIENHDLKKVGKVDAVLLVNAHNAFKDITLDSLKKMMGAKPVLIDLRSRFNREDALSKGFFYRGL